MEIDWEEKTIMLVVPWDERPTETLVFLPSKRKKFSHRDSPRNISSVAKEEPVPTPIEESPMETVPETAVERPQMGQKVRRSLLRAAMVMLSFGVGLGIILVLILSLLF